MCGEKKSIVTPALLSKGSPPRVRGKAYPLLSFAVDVVDHPRVCGEKQFYTQKIQPPKGSPPRVRGKVYSLTITVPHSRITPACAGKSRSQSATLPAALDHPRVCGEKEKADIRYFPPLGSPPRVRGKAFLTQF